MEQEAMTQRVKELVQPVLTARHVDLVELTCRNAGPRVLVRFLLDTAQGIRMDELSHLNQAIGAALDEHDAIPFPYMLEVSSPGLDRALKSQRDFNRALGKSVRFFLSEMVEGKLEHVGVVLEALADKVKIDNNKMNIEIPLAKINKAKQELSF